MVTQDLPSETTYDVITMVVRLGSRSYPIKRLASEPQPLFWDVVRHIRRIDPDAFYGRRPAWLRAVEGEPHVFNMWVHTL